MTPFAYWVPLSSPNKIIGVSPSSSEGLYNLYCCMFCTETSPCSFYPPNRLAGPWHFQGLLVSWSPRHWVIQEERKKYNTWSLQWLWLISPDSLVTNTIQFHKNAPCPQNFRSSWVFLGSLWVTKGGLVDWLTRGKMVNHPTLLSLDKSFPAFCVVSSKCGFILPVFAECCVPHCSSLCLCFGCPKDKCSLSTPGLFHQWTVDDVSELELPTEPHR